MEIAFDILVILFCIGAGLLILSVAQGIFTLLYTFSKRFRRLVDRVCKEGF